MFKMRRLIFFFLTGTLLLIAIPGFSFLSFDTQEIIDSFVYPKVNKSDLEIQRNISLTLSAYRGFCGLNRLPELKKFEDQIENGKTILRLNNEGLTFRDLEAITYALRVNKTVRIIDFKENYFGNGAAGTILNLFSENRILKTLDLGDCYIGPAGIKILENNIASLDRLTNLNPPSIRDMNLSLYLSACSEQNALPDRRWISFFKANDYSFRIPYQYEEIPFLDILIQKDLLTEKNGSEQWKELSEVILNTDTIADVLFRGNITNEPDFHEFIQSFGSNKSITNITIRDCRMDEEAITLLFRNLIQNRKVSVISIDHCELSDNSMHSLSVLFETNQNIKSFTFNYNKTSVQASLELLKTLCYSNESVDKLVAKGMVIPDGKVLADLKKKFPEKGGI